MTVDRHAVRAALGDWDLSVEPVPTDHAYRTYAAAYRMAARRVGVAPRDLQASVWVAVESYRRSPQPVTVTEDLQVPL